MAYDEQIIYEVRDAIATVTLNRPARLNAWTPQMGRELHQAFERAATDPGVRVIVVTGAGRGFCAGADMDNLRGIQSGAAGDAPSASSERAPGPGIPPLHPAPSTARSPGSASPTCSTTTCASPRIAPASVPRSRAAV